LNSAGFVRFIGRFYGKALSLLRSPFPRAPSPTITFIAIARSGIRSEPDIVVPAITLAKIRSTTSLGGP
jgi:hypothetical protein